jgi:hypothetical protein
MTNRMKYIILTLALFTIISCNNPNQKNKETDNIETRKIDPILDALTKKYANYTDNTIVRENATKELGEKIDSLLNLNYLDDIPLKVFKMEKNPHKKGALVQFYTLNHDSNRPNRLSDRLNFDIIGFMDEKLASTLKEDGTYFIYGKKLKRLSKTEVFLIVNQVYYSPGTEISKDPILNTYNFNIGDILCEIDSVKSVNNY